MANPQVSSVWGINEKGELVAVAGSGTNNVVGLLPDNAVPVDSQGRIVITGLGSSGAGTVTEILLSDATNTLFLARDSGTSVTFVKIVDGSAYTPTAPLKVAGVPGVATDATLATLLPQQTVAGKAALAVAIQSVMAGERNIGSASNSYLVNCPETNGTIVTGSTTAVQLNNQPTHLMRFMALATLVGTATIDGLTDQNGTPTPVIIPAGTAAFAPVDFSWARCETRLQVTLSNSSDKVLVNWRPI